MVLAEIQYSRMFFDFEGLKQLLLLWAEIGCSGNAARECFKLSHLDARQGPAQFRPGLTGVPVYPFGVFVIVHF